MSKKLQVCLVGFGAVGRSVFQRSAVHGQIFIDHIIVPVEQVEGLQKQLGEKAKVGSTVPNDAKLILECAGHASLKEHILPALGRGVECAVLSIGAVAESNMWEQLESAAKSGGTQVHLLSGAIGAVDALAAARLGGLQKVTYTGRKPPAGWLGSAAEDKIDLDNLSVPTVFFEASCREAAQLFPKNANVAATIALAGLGLDATTAKLIADPTIDENIHEVNAEGAFGSFQLIMRGKPLVENPKTSALTVLSALRFLVNKSQAIAL